MRAIEAYPNVVWKAELEEAEFVIRELFKSIRDGDHERWDYPRLYALIGVAAAYVGTIHDLTDEINWRTKHQVKAGEFTAFLLRMRLSTAARLSDAIEDLRQFAEHGEIPYEAPAILAAEFDWEEDEYYGN